ncbi:TetR/AcrR family transcriptional regulator [Micromonospora krabiensis]|uniref:Transcriptional regulator, TetR family n=1 Tax=Micromonospora krabiensis TaxID=307121 RepID=A0A1C3NCM3_9ACTN|nr:TetR/AcrR family transcriptional regulator [Micromonospora krabiensis]SBV30352.1 transcriptional regulator, TetR family [Micromonospora krabiensis]
MRADARRNYDLIVKAASEAVARDGAYASLEEIARSAGVGSATLHRRFPTRWSLLQAVFRGCVRNLATRAGDLLSAPDALDALTTWLHEVTAYATTTRGLADSLLNEPAEENDTCGAMLVAAGEPLLRRAVDEGSVRPDITMGDLMILANGISLAAQPVGAARAEQLLTFALEGIRSAGRPQPRPTETPPPLMDHGASVHRGGG